MIELIRSWISRQAEEEPAVTFTASPELYGAIPEPTPATREIPQWYSDTPMIRGGGTRRTHPSDEVTVRGCIPFLEGMTTGWVMKTPTDIYITRESKGTLSVVTPTDRTVVQSRDMVQGMELGPTDFLLSINTFWSIKTSPGYLTYNLPLLNKFDSRFRTMSGLIESDSYQDTHKVELLWREDSPEGHIPAGTPISQVITVDKDSVNMDGRIRERTPSEETDLDRFNIMRNAIRHFYRERVWSAESKSRVIPDTQSDGSGSCPMRNDH
jgi:hypothetical protein